MLKISLNQNKLKIASKVFQVCDKQEENGQEMLSFLVVGV